MTALPLDARIRWNRLRIMGALIRLEQESGIKESSLPEARKEGQPGDALVNAARLTPGLQGPAQHPDSARDS